MHDCVLESVGMRVSYVAGYHHILSSHAMLLFFLFSIIAENELSDNVQPQGC